MNTAPSEKRKNHGEIGGSPIVVLAGVAALVLALVWGLCWRMPEQVPGPYRVEDKVQHVGTSGGLGVDLDTSKQRIAVPTPTLSGDPQSVTQSLPADSTGRTDRTARRLEHFLALFSEHSNLDNAHPVLCLSIALLIERYGCGVVRDCRTPISGGLRTSDADPWIFIYNGKSYEFEANRFPEYGDWMRALGSQQAKDHTVEARNTLDPDLGQRILKLAEEAQAVANPVTQEKK